jgi:magnesium transporter
MIKKRAGWLTVLLIGEMFTTSALELYEERFAGVLILLLPLILSSGGNSGSQATTLIVRAMALDQVRLRDWWRIVRRELSSGLALGAILAALGAARILAGHWLFEGSFTEHYLWVGCTIAISLIGVVTLGTLIGALLPLFLRTLGFDPASASAPVVATLLDVSGVLIYFNVAQWMLAGRLL